MCRHCEKTTEDKEIIHTFMERMALRLSEKTKCRVTPDMINLQVELYIPNLAAQLLKSINDPQWFL